MIRKFVMNLKSYLPYILIGTGILMIITTYIKNEKDLKKKELE